MQIKPQLDHLGIPLLAIGNGSKLFARGVSLPLMIFQFITSTPFTGHVFVDPDSLCFKAMELKRLTLWQALRHFFNSTARAAFKTLREKREAKGDLLGDGQQTGGVFVVGPGERSTLSYIFKEQDHPVGVDNFADVKAILQACGWTEQMQQEFDQKIIEPSDNKNVLDTKAADIISPEPSDDSKKIDPVDEKPQERDLNVSEHDFLSDKSKGKSTN